MVKWAGFRHEEEVWLWGTKGEAQPETESPQWTLPRANSSTHVHKESRAQGPAERITPGQFLPTWLFKNRKGRGLEGHRRSWTDHHWNKWGPQAFSVAISSMKHRASHCLPDVVPLATIVLVSLINSSISFMRFPPNQFSTIGGQIITVWNMNRNVFLTQS